LINRPRPKKIDNNLACNFKNGRAITKVDPD
jgi:hypothetical protein